MPEHMQLTNQQRFRVHEREINQAIQSGRTLDEMYFRLRDVKFLIDYANELKAELRRVKALRKEEMDTRLNMNNSNVTINNPHGPLTRPTGR